ncbi:carboxypeptidase-like regulatory domain-containing protein [Flavobacterium sp. RHBU_3]|uniref:carboxypeptidase-like regulatory domain-containing protein n=1 Tax=Flavobacterium sp. RHBU_3 TaxID=3391184 RepID=UPI003984A469
MKKLVLSLLFMMQFVCAWAQQSASVQGKVVDAKTQKPLQNVVATIEATGQTALTNAEGVFVFNDLAPESHVLTVTTAGYVPQTFTVEAVAGKPLDLGVVSLELDITSEQQLGLITITDNDLGDDNSGSENTAGLLQASRDTYQQAAAFNWGQARFRIRGLDNQYGNTMINGVMMNKIYDGRPNWSNWGGLNDATRNQEFTMGSAPSDYTFGNILGTQEINTRASIYRPGLRVSYSGTNTNYSWRMMGTYSSGMRADGWAYVISASRRWAQEGYFDGTDYSANSFFASVEKKINDHHSLNFTSIYAQNSRGKNSPNTKEVTDIAGEKYNSYWGWQDGKKRNSRDKDVEEPILMLSHYWTIGETTSLNTNVSYQFGQIGNSRLDYQNANNPDPTYYRNLPSYLLSTGMTAHDADSLANFNNGGRQINWNQMYQANANTANGRSAYVLYEDRTDDKTLTANTILRSQLSDNISLNGGASYRHLKSHNFQNLLDLLGGQFFEDVDNYYTGSYAQSDLNNPNRRVGEGDTYGYNYNLYANVADAFAQLKFNYRKVDFYVGGTYSYTEYQREGLYKNGLYPNNSFGKSDKLNFDNYGIKGGVTYKLNGRNMIVLNAVRMTQAPTLRNAYPNARLNNNAIDGIQNETVTSGDISYVIRTPRLKTKITGFYATIENSIKTSFFYGDGIFEGEDNGAFVAETVTGVNKLMMGGEFGIEYNLSSTITVKGAASYGKYTYNNNPNVSINNDALATNGDDSGVGTIDPTTTVNYGSASLKNYKLGGVPQQAYSLGIEYRDPHYWWVGVNGNYLADNYVEVSSLMRTENFFKNAETLNGVPYDDVDLAEAKKLLKQEKFDNFFLMNLQGGKSWKIGKQLVGLFVSVNNVLNQSYKTGGFEQSRNATYGALRDDMANGKPLFGSKYFYGYGRNYFVNLYINF